MLKHWPTGRVWSGADALKRRLVDRIGGPDAALQELKSRLDIAPKAIEQLQPRLVFSHTFDEPPPARAFLDTMLSEGHELYDLLTLVRQGHHAPLPCAGST